MDYQSNVSVLPHAIILNAWRLSLYLHMSPVDPQSSLLDGMYNGRNNSQLIQVTLLSYNQTRVLP